MAEASKPADHWEEGDQPTRSAIFARQVRRLREQRGWSQGELAHRLAEAGHPIGQSRVSTIEAPGPEPRTVALDQAQAFADAFGVPLEQLIFEDWPITRTVLLRELLDIVDVSDRFAVAAVEGANTAREMVARFLQENPGWVPDGTTERLAPVELRRGSVQRMRREAAKRRREHHERGE